MQISTAALNKIKGVAPDAVREIYETVFELGLGLVEPYASRFLGPKDQRVFSFGPYTGEGPKMIKGTAKIISELGYCALTAHEFYPPGRPDSPRPLSEAVPNPFLLLEKQFQSHVYLKYLPRLASKAVFYHNDERAQLYELEGCEDSNIPRLGYVKRNRLYSESRQNSAYLVVSPDRRSAKCVAPAKDYCGYSENGHFCPFYEPAPPVSWSSLQMYLTEDSTIVAIKELQDLKEPLSRFLRDGAGKTKS